jgi:hypothetical protein
VLQPYVVFIPQNMLSVYLAHTNEGTVGGVGWSLGLWRRNNGHTIHVACPQSFLTLLFDGCPLFYQVSGWIMSETLDTTSTLTQVMTQEDFIA